MHIAYSELKKLKGCVLENEFGERHAVTSVTKKRVTLDRGIHILTDIFFNKISRWTLISTPKK